MGGLSSGSLAGQEQRSGPGKTPQPRPVGCGRGWGGARRKLSLSPGTQRCSAVSCGPPALPREGPPALSHSPASDRPARRCCQEEAHSATAPLTQRRWGLVIPRFSGPLGRGCTEDVLRGAGPPIRLPGLHWAGAEQLPPRCGGAVTRPLSHCPFVYYEGDKRD